MEHFVPVTVGILTHQFLWLLTEAYSLSKGSWKQWVKSHQSLDQKLASPGVSPFVFLQTLSGCSFVSGCPSHLSPRRWPMQPAGASWHRQSRRRRRASPKLQQSAWSWRSLDAVWWGLSALQGSPKVTLVPWTADSCTWATMKRTDQNT